MMKRVILCISLFLVLGGVLSAQCIYRDTVTLEDLSANNFYLEIKDVLNNDLSDPNQGVCGVSIEFMHDRLGNILIELISPAGDMVALVGPTGNFGATAFTIWDVSFAPCSGAAAPDPGFSDQWDSDQAWGSFGSYTGTYYPFNGCLGNFDDGPVNGTWTLHIEDNHQFDDGAFFEFSILFCDPSGISCQSCFSDPGSFSQTTAVICEDETNTFNWPDPVYENNQQPDTALYGYRYVLSANDSILGFYDSKDQPLISEDTFDLCGLNYLYADSTVLDTLMDSLQTVSSLDSLLSSVQPPLCASLTEQCVRYIIDSIPPNTRDTAFLCPGRSIQYGDSTITQTGTYELAFPSQPGCDSTVILEVYPLVIEASIATPDTLSCARQEVVLDASTSILTDSTEIHWTTTDGHFVSGTDSLTPTVDSAGIYVLFLDNGECWDTTQVAVAINNDAPEALAIGDTIGCGQDSVQLFGSSSESGSTLSWTGPGGFTSTGNNPWVQSPGDYVLTVMDSDGCTAMDTAVVDAIGQLPRASVMSDPLGCEVDSVRLLVRDTAYINSYNWEGPMGFASDSLEPTVAVPGWYNLHLSFSQQCNTTISYLLTIDTMPPDYELLTDTLTCSDTIAQLAVLSSDSLEVSWNGPGGMTTIGDTIETDKSGLYELQITAMNGCSTTDSLQLLAFTQPQDITLSAENLGCRPDSASINLTIEDLSMVDSISWNGPNDFISAEQNPRVTEEGVYTVNVVGNNGCVSNGIIQVERFEEPPEFALTTDTLTCSKDTITIELSATDTLVQTRWTGPGGYISDAEDPSVFREGWYLVLAKGTDSCTTLDSIYVHSRIVQPQVDLQLMEVSCLDSNFVISSNVVPSSANLQWFGPEMIQTDSNTVSVGTPGWYTLTATTADGCVGMDSILVEDTLMGPQFALQGDTLNCDVSVVTLEADPVESEWRFSWAGPNFSSDSTSPQVSQAGVYQVTVTDEDGCTTRDSIRIVRDTISPDISLPDSILVDDCRPDTVNLTLDAGGSSAGPQFEIQWFNPEGTFLGGTNTLTPQVAVPGKYVLQIRNSENGCVARDTVEVLSNPNLLKGMDFTVIPLGCSDTSAGGLVLHNISGGEDPYSISLNDSVLIDPLDDTIPLSTAGGYKLEVLDANLCVIDTNFMLQQADPPMVDLGADITIQQGEQVWLHGQVMTNVPLTDIRWEPTGLSPTDSLAMEVMPTQTTTYSLTISDGRNCTAIDSMTVFVERSDDLYIPNTFTPNNDGINDFFYVHSASDAMVIKRFRIFNRWGNLLFEERNIPPNNPSRGWNGRFNGKTLNPGVYVYIIEVVNVDGEVEQYAGDVTLVR